jgi:hypothetical protein
VEIKRHHYPKARVTSSLLRGVKEWRIKERRIEVKTKTRQEGWVLEKTTHERIWHSGTFGDLCMLD